MESAHENHEFCSLHRFRFSLLRRALFYSVLRRRSRFLRGKQSFSSVPMVMDAAIATRSPNPIFSVLGNGNTLLGRKALLIRNAAEVLPKSAVSSSNCAACSSSSSYSQSSFLKGNKALQLQDHPAAAAAPSPSPSPTPSPLIYKTFPAAPRCEIVPRRKSRNSYLERPSQLVAWDVNSAWGAAADRARLSSLGSLVCQAQASETIAAKSPKKSERGADQDNLNGQDRLSKVPVSNIRNFSIIAHIDHGKSTLADKLLQKTGTVQERDMKEQFLDNMDLERERGITIKLQAARMRYAGKDGDAYCLNLIDTPGHVDFSYEVSRSLAACEGALLVVDASQGVEAQTLANVYLALENNLEIIPVLNKIDLPGADPDRVAKEIEEIIGLDCTDAIRCSAKEGIGIIEILQAVIDKIPAPKDTVADPLRALIFDSYFDPYRGVIVYFRVVDGSVKEGDVIQFMASGKEYQVIEIGVLSPSQMPVKELQAGEVGYLAASIRSVADARVGDTITGSTRKAGKALPGYQEAVPMVFCGLFPIEADQFPVLREALGKLQLNDAALKFEPEASSAMGFGFRCGFLGLLHMEIVQERLEREYNLDLITTAPSVVYKIICSDETVVECSNPSQLPDPGKRRSIQEPYIKMDMIAPKEFIGPLMELAQERRGIFKEMKYITENRTSLLYDLPLGEMVGDFFDQLKSRSKGYASMEYSLVGYRESDLVRLDILINGEIVDPLATIVHRDKAFPVGRALTKKLKELIPRQLFKIPIQACIGAKVIASESISAMRKDVLAKCYGGDITRKKKLLSKQAEGKKRMKAVGKVDVPQDAFMAVLRLEKEVL